jgi:hypothetical protein
LLSSADACAGDREREEEREARWSRLEGSAGRERMAEKLREKRVGGGGVRSCIDMVEERLRREELTGADGVDREASCGTQR